MADSSASYIHMVHHLIEECLIFNMSKEECMETSCRQSHLQCGVSLKRRIKASLRCITTQEGMIKHKHKWSKSLLPMV